MILPLLASRTQLILASCEKRRTKQCVNLTDMAQLEGSLLFFSWGGVLKHI